MYAKIILFIFVLSNFICHAEQPHEYLRKHEDSVSYFAEIPEITLPELTSGKETSEKLDVNQISKLVFDLAIFTKDTQDVVKAPTFASAFAIQVGDEVALAGSYHALRMLSQSDTQIAILAKGSDGVWFHIEKFYGVSAKTDFVVMKPSTKLQFSFSVAPKKPQALEPVYACGRLGSFSGVFRKGELMAKQDSFLLTSIAATQGSSGSPVFNESGQLVGMIVEVIPLLRESGLYTGDHFAEYVITKCREF